MGERWLSIKEVSEKIGKSSQTVTDYCNEGKFPRANRPGGGKWVIPEGDVEAYLTGKPAIALAPPVEIPEAIKKAEENASIAEAERKEAIARKEAEAAKSGFATADEWDKAQKEFNELVEKTKSELENDKKQIFEQKQKYDEGILTNAELQKQLKEQLKLANEQIMEQESINIQAKKDAEANIMRILKRFRGGTVGLIEKALFNMTSPPVKRAWVSFKCNDCHKTDGVDRTAHFNIPTLDWLSRQQIKYGFGACVDCDQVDSRNLPTYICDLCPIYFLMVKSSALLVDALVTVGVKAIFDTDGQYRPSVLGIDDKKRQYTKDEQIKILLEKFGVEEEDNLQIKLEKPAKDEEIK